MTKAECFKCKSVVYKEPGDALGCSICGYMSEKQESKSDDFLKWFEETKKWVDEYMKTPQIIPMPYPVPWPAYPTLPPWPWYEVRWITSTTTTTDKIALNPTLEDSVVTGEFTYSVC